MFRSAEQTNFYQKLKVHLSNPDAPLLLEGTTGLGKTRAYLAAVADAVSAGKKIALILPTHMLIEQLISSPDRKAVLPNSVSVHAFLPRSRFESQGDYTLQRQQARSADVLVATNATVAIVPADRALPALKPNQPAPNKIKGTL